MQLWLFDHPPVTWEEVWTWTEEVAGIPRTSWRAAYYAHWWNVAEKIAHIKSTASPHGTENTVRPPAQIS